MYHTFPEALLLVTEEINVSLRFREGSHELDEKTPKACTREYIPNLGIAQFCSINTPRTIDPASMSAKACGNSSSA